MQFLAKLDQLEVRFDELTRQLADPDVIGDSDRYRKAAKAHSELAEVVAKYREWKKVAADLEQGRAMIHETDPELRAMATDEVSRLEPVKSQIEEELKILLLPRDPNDEKNVVLEIRAGTGGDEASLFAQELFRMYARYAESQGWKVEVLSTSPSPVGGLKEVIASIQGDKVY
ncbi:MAG: PCRF domain-containing protein, partial [Bryobacteraceae bacterium]